MPAATPVPRGPTVLALYTAADLLTGPGCPVCRYAGESADRYLAWFAFEAHADAATVTRLCSSLGMCARHTRGLMGQPGAARRLTAVYRYLLRAAEERLSGHAGQLAGCPACEHDERTAGSALETLIEGLADDGSVRDRYLQLGGLCVPHLRSASARADRRVIAWLVQAVTAAVSASPASPGWLAGTDHDAAARAALRRAATSARTQPNLDVCVACLASGRAEYDRLTWIAHHAASNQPEPGPVLCAGHLSDLMALAGERDAVPLLAWQAASLVPASPAAWLGSRRRADGSGGCAVCASAESAARHALDDLRAALRAASPAPGRPAALCVRHLLNLAAADPRAGKIAAPAAMKRAGALIAELDEAFGKGTWARRREARGQEMTAWRRAVAFLDGGVFCGCPPTGTG